MSCRGAILIDNFLPQDVFDDISTKVSNTPQYTSGVWSDERDNLWNEVTLLVFDRLRELSLYKPHFEKAAEIYNFSHHQYRPAGYGGDSPGQHVNQPHSDDGSHVFYIHPHWDESWGGRLQIIDAVEEEYREGIYARPNRFIWIQPTILHDITAVSEQAEHARVTNLGFLGGEYHDDFNPVGTEYINIFTN